MAKQICLPYCRVLYIYFNFTPIHQNTQNMSLINKEEMKYDVKCCLMSNNKKKLCNQTHLSRTV